MKRGLERLLEKRKGDEQHGGHRVCVLTPNCAAFSSALLGIWSCALPVAAVPLCKAHPEKTLEYYVADSGASVILTTGDYADKARVSCLLKYRLKLCKNYIEAHHGWNDK